MITDVCHQCRVGNVSDRATIGSAEPIVGDYTMPAIGSLLVWENGGSNAATSLDCAAALERIYHDQATQSQVIWPTHPIATNYQKTPLSHHPPALALPPMKPARMPAMLVKTGSMTWTASV